jgi:hypothetical protein
MLELGSRESAFVLSCAVVLSTTELFKAETGKVWLRRIS